LFAVLAAAQYAYLLRMTAVGAYVEQPVHGLGDVVEMVTGGRFRRQMFTFGPTELVRDRLPLLGRFLRRDLGVLAVPVAYGAVRVVRSGSAVARAVTVHLGLLGGLAAVHALNFDVADVEVFFLPTVLVLAVLLAVGLDGLAGRMAARVDVGGQGH